MYFNLAGNMFAYSLILGAIISFLASSTSAATLGGIDIQAACFSQYDSSYVAHLQGNTAFGWACGKPVDMDEACREQYRRGDTHATHGSTANSWQCVV